MMGLQISIICITLRKAESGGSGTLLADRTKRFKLHAQGRQDGEGAGMIICILV